MLDTIQILLWSAAYILIIVASFLSCDIKKVAMPYAAGVLNFAWEACALQMTKDFWGHYFWLGLDLFIVGFGFFFLYSVWKKGVYIASIYAFILVLSRIFVQDQGMLISVFVIDLIMAVSFLLDRKKLTPRLKIPIAVFRLLGDACAGLYYAPHSMIVCILAILVALCNVIYLVLCILERTCGKRLAEIN